MTTPGGQLPTPVTAFVVIALTALLAYNIIVSGPEGLPTSYILGGLLAAYTGVDQLIKRKNGNGNGGGS